MRGKRRWVPAARVATVFAAISAAPAPAVELRAPGGGAVHALVVGINTYSNLPRSSWLNGAAPDAQDLDQALGEGGVEDKVSLLNSDATRANFVTQMDRLVAVAKPGDLVFISFAGHGMQVQEYDRWRGVDPNGVNEQIALSGYGFKGPGAGEVIVNEEVRAWLSRFDAKGVDVLVLWDSCFGGGMRDVAPGSGGIRVRKVEGSPEELQRRRFTGIEMTEKEARADFKTLTHVTFLSGADANSVVPEMQGVDPLYPSVARGALSYYVARALRGVSTRGGVTRGDLFKFLKQNVSQATARRQIIQVDPQSADTAVSGKTVFVISTDERPPPPAPSSPVPSPGASTPIDAVPADAVRLAIENGPADAFASVERGATPIALVDDPKSAELVWNPSNKEAFAHGDLLMRNIDGSMIGALADRMRAVSRLRAAGEAKTLALQLSGEGSALVPGDFATVSVGDLAGAQLVVFNIAADATVQMLYPSAPSEPAHCSSPQHDAWLCKLRIEPPFGVDTVVAVATARDPGDLLTWLRAHHGKRDAATAPELFASIAGVDDGARIGFVEVVTAARK